MMDSTESNMQVYDKADCLKLNWMKNLFIFRGPSDAAVYYIYLT